MTPEEVFAQLRDIHSPPIEAATHAPFDLGPLVAFIAFLGVVFIGRYALSYWRRQTAMARIDPAADPAAQRDALTKLVAATPKARRRDNLADAPPHALFDPPEALTPKAIADLRTWARRRLS